MAKIKQTTTTTLVLEALRAAEQEFMSLPMLMQVTKRSANDCSAALHHLRKHRAVDVVVEKDGSGWWFATGDDDRSRKLDEIRVGIIRPRLKKVTPKGEN